MFSQVSFDSRVHDSLNHDPPALASSVPKVTGLQPKSQLYRFFQGLRVISNQPFSWVSVT